ncbi:uncharacterized protein C1orf189 homolog isoform X1 [Oxyura jamaicensis]|uniref:uncharacterized protein C1orf189 homolog isoform X1 n=1 Tax=Oxyura jamaicensis TaxID=8884 RepID=UPI0015A5470D|nr:uncharacterized protein C1orf189 homolog isoform X1 [Oxyura jamaicensis]
MPRASGCQEPFPAGSKAAAVTMGLSPRCRPGDGDAGSGNGANGPAGAGGGCGVPTAPAMAAATGQTLSLRQEQVGAVTVLHPRRMGKARAGSSPPPMCWLLQVLAKERACAEGLRSWGQAAGEHPQRQERIWAMSLGALRGSLAVELCLASKEQTTVRRAALRRLLHEEQQQHQRELRQLGKAFYVERL